MKLSPCHRKVAAVPLAGFGIDELLALLGIGAVLAAVLIIPLQQSKRRARQELCSQNLQQVNHAVQLFSEDHDGKFPGLVAESAGELQWWYKEQVKPYVGVKGSVSPNTALFACPEDRGYSDPQPFHQSARFDYGSYNFNGVLLPGAPNIAGMATSAITEPKRTLLTMEWTAHAPLSWHRSRTGKRNSPFYRDAESVVAFVDGHVSLSKIYFDGYTPAYMRDPIGGYDYRYSGN